MLKLVFYTNNNNTQIYLKICISMNIIVMKFGGTSVSSIEKLNFIEEKISFDGKKFISVPSLSLDLPTCLSGDFAFPSLAKLILRSKWRETDQGTSSPPPFPASTFGKSTSCLVGFHILCNRSQHSRIGLVFLCTAWRCNWRGYWIWSAKSCF